MKKTIAAAALLLCSALALSSCGTHLHSYVQTVVPPTCRSMGYTLQVCDCGHRAYLDYSSMVSHEYGAWQTYTEASLISFGEEQRVCIHCGNLEIRSTAMLGEVPTVFLTERSSFTFLSGEERTTYHAAIYPDAEGVGGKLGYTLSMIRQANTYGIDFGNGAESEFRLDPCTPDRTFSRAATAEQLWQKSLELRQQEDLLPTWVPVQNSTGFPVRVFMGDAYLGLYRLLPGDTGSVSQETAAILYAGGGDASCLFEEPPKFGQTADAFSILSYGGENPDAACESFADFSAFVRESSASSFRNHLQDYTDITALMDYFLLRTFFGLPAGDTEGTVWSTTDGIHWTPSFYHLNNAFGLTADGYQGTALNGIPAPVKNQDGTPEVSYNGNNLLWKKLCQVFPAELTARYAVLRESFLTPENVYGMYMQIYQEIGTDLRKQERDLYPALPVAAWTTRHVEDYTKKRLSLMDSWLFFAFG